MKKIGFVSLGCPKNLVDSEVMMGLVKKHGYQLTADQQEAEIVVVNTCAFIDPAKEESIDTILEMAELKKTGRCQKLVVTGCLVERYRDVLAQEMPEIDAVLGTNEVENILKVCEPESSPEPGRRPLQRPTPRGLATESGRRPLQRPTPRGLATEPGRRPLQRPTPRGLETEPGRRPLQRPTPRGLETAPTSSRAMEYLYDHTTPRVLSTPRYTAYIKIAEGCDHTCDFCIIPQLRGRMRSRQMESVVQEARALADQGVREVILVGQDTTHYGEDLGRRNGLAQLLRQLARVDGLRWVRFLYGYPHHVTDELLDVVASEGKLCQYFDIPFQHASQRILQRMRRGGSRAALERLVERIRQRMPQAALRTSFIVGYPGETEEDFQELLDHVRQVQFNHVGVFTYSDEEGTAAYHHPDKVPARTARARRRTLMKEQARISRRKNRELVGQRVEVLLEGVSNESEFLLQGRMESQAPEIDGCVLINEVPEGRTLEPGQFVTVEITRAFDHDVLGRIV